MEIVYRCKEHGIEFTNSKEADKHIWDFHTPFKKICLLNGKPCSGFCTVKEQYESCQVSFLGKVIMNNWMCWRDGILKNPNEVDLKVKVDE